MEGTEQMSKAIFGVDVHLTSADGVEGPLFLQAEENARVQY